MHLVNLANELNLKHNQTLKISNIMETSINFDRLETLNFYGTDASLDISLLEYGLLARTWETAKDTYQFIYVTEWKHYAEPKSFDITVLSNNEINEIFDDLNDDNGLLDFVGMNETQWKELDVTHKVSDLIRYYGIENIFGISYGGYMTDAELNEYFAD